MGDTIRISYASDPIHEVEDGKELLQVLGLRPRTEPELIACPTCGRIEIDLISMMTEVRKRLSEIDIPVKVAVMGCVVNGPGECEGADAVVAAYCTDCSIYLCQACRERSKRRHRVRDPSHPVCEISERASELYLRPISLLFNFDDPSSWSREGVDPLGDAKTVVEWCSHYRGSGTPDWWTGDRGPRTPHPRPGHK